MCTDPIEVDGAQGEGGGQILRTSLSLAALQRRPLRLHRIRHRRGKPGLLRQHLTAVRALAEITDAEVTGASLGSRELSIVPKAARGGVYHFSIGSAGSTTLVAQTILPVLLFADGPSEVTLEGGTHNPSAPPFEFLTEVVFPVLREMGAAVDASLEVPGFYPAGGGRFVMRVEPVTSLEPVRRVECPSTFTLEAEAVVSRLPRRVAMRELAVVEAAFPAAARTPVTVTSPGPGNLTAIAVKAADVVYERCTAFGERGRPAEAVAEVAVEHTRRFLAAGVPVGEHLADQLVLLAALAKPGSQVRTVSPSLHTTTNVEVVNHFLGAGTMLLEERDDGWWIERL